MKSIFIVTGPRGAGKTNLCSAVAKRVADAGWNVTGLISPGNFVDGRKMGIEARDLSTGERKRLAEVRVGQQEPDDGQVATQAWIFDSDVLDWGNQVLAKAVPTDLLVIDELGSLEFERQLGWVEGFNALDGEDYRAALIVVRPDQLAEARRRWPTSVAVPVERFKEDQVDELVRDVLAQT